MLRKLIAIAIVAVCAAAGAQPYPSKPVILIVPFSPGGPTDVVARSLAAALGRALGQSVIVENKASSGGIVGSEAVQRAEPDGYTLLIHNIGMSTLPALSRNLRFNPLKDFAYIGEVVDVPMALVGRKDLKPTGFKDLLPYLKAQQRQVNIANAGMGTASHLCGLLLMSRLNIAMTSVSYKGAAPALTDLMGGHVDILCDQVTTTTQPIRGGLIRAYGATTEERLATLPEVQTLHEQGLSDFQIAVWHGVYAPKATPRQIVDRLAGALRAALVDKEFSEAMARLGALPVSPDRASPNGLQMQLSREVERWTPIIQKAQIYLD
ncbi:MAG: tripartite tricarboxylate transporter substrate binding protein BugD [Variovorax sp.]|nr:MAG: tripartite tricarboxylate transporter substrate binding protein BugD [Variovorax sp.]